MKYGIAGDPEAMRALADELVAMADVARHAGHGVKKRWGKVDIAGPLASEMAAEISTAAEGFGGAADLLDGAAKLLRSSAREVAEAVAAEKRQRWRKGIID